MAISCHRFPLRKHQCTYTSDIHTYRYLVSSPCCRLDPLLLNRPRPCSLFALGSTRPGCAYCGLLVEEKGRAWFEKLSSDRCIVCLGGGMEKDGSEGGWVGGRREGENLEQHIDPQHTVGVRWDDVGQRGVRDRGSIPLAVPVPSIHTTDIQTGPMVWWSR